MFQLSNQQLKTCGMLVILHATPKNVLVKVYLSGKH